MLSAWLLVAADARDHASSQACGLAARELSALVLVSSRPGRNVDWLYRRLGITPSGAVRLVDRLEGLGLLRREKTAGKREVALHVTEAGNDRLADGLKARAAALESQLAPLSERERSQLIALVTKVLGAGTRARAEADVACRLCEWGLCRPDCPLDASVIDEGDRRF